MNRPTDGYQPCQWTFGWDYDEPAMGGWTDGSTWNGFANVIADPAAAAIVRPILVAHATDDYTDADEIAEQLREIDERTYSDGSLDLSYGYTTWLVSPYMAALGATPCDCESPAHVDTARSIALMPGEDCPGPCPACARHAEVPA